MLKLVNVLVWTALAEYLVFELFEESVIVRVKLQGAIGLVMISYMVHTAYRIWYIVKNPLSNYGIPE